VPFRVFESPHSLSYSDRRGRRINPVSLPAGEPRRGRLPDVDDHWSGNVEIGVLSDLQF